MKFLQLLYIRFTTQKCGLGVTAPMNAKDLPPAILHTIATSIQKEVAVLRNLETIVYDETIETRVQFQRRRNQHLIKRDVAMRRISRLQHKNLELSPKINAEYRRQKHAALSDGRNDIIEHDQYVATRHILGAGEWGTVYLGEDVVLNKLVAIKCHQPSTLAHLQASQRGLSPWDAVMKEVTDLDGCAHIVQRYGTVSKDGTPFIVMPFYSEFLSHKFVDHTQIYRKWLGNGFGMDVVTHVLRDVSHGLAELHLRHRVMGDLKADNIAIGPFGKYMLCDLGTSTFDIANPWNARNAMGSEYVRAPECFAHDSHPSPASDIWSFGSLLYRCLTNEYILEGPLDKIIPIDSEFQEAELAYDMIRHFGLVEGVQAIAKGVQKGELDIGSAKDFVPDESLRDGLRAGRMSAKRFAQAMVSFRLRHVPHCLYSLLRDCLDADPQKRIQSGMDLVARIEKLPLNPNLRMNGHIDAVSTWLIKPYTQVVNKFRKDFLPTNEYQFMCTANHIAKDDCLTISDEWKKQEEIVLSPLQVIIDNINHATTQFPKASIEDIAFVVRLGYPLLLEAKRLANSQDFGAYVMAKTPDGSFLIDEEERRFVQLYVQQIHSYMRE